MTDDVMQTTGTESLTPLKAWLNEQGMTQAALARSLGFAPPIVSLVARGLREPGGEFKYRFARMTGDLALTEKLFSGAAAPAS